MRIGLGLQGVEDSGGQLSRRRGLHQRIHCRCPQRMTLVAALDPGMADLTRFQPTEARVTVISPRLKAAPVAPTLPRTITAPISGWRRTWCGGRSGKRAASRAGGALASVAIQVFRESGVASVISCLDKFTGLSSNLYNYTNHTRRGLMANRRVVNF